MRTLIVEDELANRLLLQTFLAQHGDCHVVVNGKEAVEAFRMALGEGRPYDLVCMDILMPEMDGHQAAREIRSLERMNGPHSSRARIVMITASPDAENVNQSLREHCDAYLLKPVDIRRLRRELQSFGLAAV